MSFLGLGPWEVILILVIVLILFGPTKLPQLARSIGEAVREFRKASKEVTSPEEKTTTKKSALDVIDETTLKELAEKLGIESEGKTKEELAKEIIAKAKEKKIISDEYVERLKRRMSDTK